MPRRKKKAIELCGDCQQSTTKCKCQKLAPRIEKPPFDPRKTQLLDVAEAIALILETFLVRR